MRPQGRKLALILEWQPRRSDLGADFNPEWYSGTSVGTPDPRTPTERPSSAQRAPSERRQCTTSGTHPRAHQEHAQRDHRALSSVTRAASRVISSADPAASRAVQCHPRGHQVPTERHQQRQQQRQPRRTRGHQPHNERHQERATSGPAPSAAFSAHRAASFAPPAAPTECPPSATSSDLSGIRAQRTALRAATTERHQAGQQQCQPSAHHTDQRCRASVALREAPTHVFIRSAQRSAPPLTSRAHRAPSGAPASAAPTERLPRPQQRSAPISSAHRAALVPNRRPQQRQPSANHRAHSSAQPRPQQRRRSPAALTERQRERQPQPHRSATAARQQHLPCARRITPLVAPSHATRSAHRVIPSRAIGSATARMPSVSGKKKSEDAESKPDPAAAGLEEDRFFTASGDELRPRLASFIGGGDHSPALRERFAALEAIYPEAPTQRTSTSRATSPMPGIEDHTLPVPCLGNIRKSPGREIPAANPAAHLPHSPISTAVFAEKLRGWGISNLIRLVDHGANLVRLKLKRVDAGDPWGSFWFDADETSPGVARLKDPTLAVCVMGIFKSDSGVTPKKRMI
nr:uncharacterized protein DKFZp434B061-like [Drosophila suzukii]